MADERADAELVREALLDDQDAFRELVVRYQQPVYACALHVTRNPADAADAAQEAFIRLHRHLDQYDCSRPLRPYLMTLALNAARNTVRSRSRLRWDGYHETADLERMADAAPGPEHAAVRRERAESLRALVQSLPQTMRDVCHLFYLADRSVREVSTILKMSESAVKTALHRARARLRQRLLAEGGLQ